MSLCLIKHKLFLFRTLSLERCLTSVLQSSSSTSSSWMGAFSPWKHLNGVRRIGSSSLHSSKVCQEFNGVLSSINVHRGSDVPTTRQYTVVTVIDNTTHLQERTTRCLEMRHLVMSTFDFKSALHITSESPKRHRRVWDQRQKKWAEPKA